MAGRLLLDTSAIVELLRGEAGPGLRLDPADTVFVPVIAIGELLAGALRSERRDDNVAQVERIASGANVISCDAHTAREYASIRHQLRLKGRPIPENDMWIAATARQHGLTLVAGVAHFQQIDGLSVLPR